MRDKAEILLQNLGALQNRIKRDPESYKQEFLLQYAQFQSHVAIFNLDPATKNNTFSEQVMFLASVAVCYPIECKNYPETLINLLTNHHMIMEPDLRRTMVQALMQMKNRNLVPQSSLLSLFFTLFRCNDKALRALIHGHIVSDIKNSNLKAKNNKLNKTLQNFMFKMLKDPSDIAAKKSLEVMIELYHRNIWNDAKTVNVISEACLMNIPKIVAPGLHFFLGKNDKKFDEEDDEEGAGVDLDQMKHQNGINKKRKSRSAKMDRALAKVRKMDRGKETAEVFNFSALHLLNDPQGFSEHLFSRLRMVTQKNLFNFELRLEMMNLISRLIGIHKLTLLSFYDFLISYLKPHQKEVTKILGFLAQSAHELVPPDALEAVIRAIADNFVWSNCASQVITAGLNGLREICTRCPLAMPEDLLKHFMEDYKNHRDRGPMQAARALLNLYREFNPHLLKKKDRGKTASMKINSVVVPMYGQVPVADDVCDAELLEENTDDEQVVEEFEESEGEKEFDQVHESDAEGEEERDNAEGEDQNESEEEVEEEEEAEEQDLEDNNSEKGIEPVMEKPKVILATQKIFTDEDYAKMKLKREQRDAEELVGRKRPSKVQIDDSEDSNDENVVNTDKIMKFVKSGKENYDERRAKMLEGREGREKYGSKRGKEERASSTNKEKSRKNKPMTMLVHKRSVKSKKSRSLRDKQKILRKHIAHVAKKGH